MYEKTMQPIQHPFRIFVQKEAESLYRSVGTIDSGLHFGPLHITGTQDNGPVAVPEWFLEGYLDLPLAFDVKTRAPITIL